MNKIRIDPEVKYAIDCKGTVVIKSDHESLFMDYPEAAVWFLLLDKTKQKKAIMQINAVLTGTGLDDEHFVAECLKKWKMAGLIEY